MGLGAAGWLEVPLMKAESGARLRTRSRWRRHSDRKDWDSVGDKLALLG